MRRSHEQRGFADHLVGERSRRNDRLEGLAQALDWGSLEALLSPIHSAPRGAPGYAPLVMLKVVLLQQWYGLSDPEMEAALADRLSFLRFVGLSLDEPTPDHSTISRFRGALIKHGLGDALFAAVQRQLDGRGLIVRRGTLVDATLISGAAAKPSIAEGSLSPVDPDARWGKKGRQAFHGYKLHIAVDQGSHLIRAAHLTPANRNDCELGPDLVQGDEQIVYGDMGYDNAAIRTKLADLGIANGVMKRPHKTGPLTPEQLARNAALRPIRAPVERVFGTLKRTYRLNRMRYIGLVRNKLHMMMLAIAMNLRRSVVLAT
jgi:IS5 family transposase